MAICASKEKSYCKKRPVYAVGGYTRSLSKMVGLASLPLSPWIGVAILGTLI